MSRLLLVVLLPLWFCQCQNARMNPSAQPMAPVFGGASPKPAPASVAGRSSTAAPAPPADRTPPAFPAYPAYPSAPTASPAPTSPLWKVESTSAPQRLAHHAAYFEVRLAAASEKCRMHVVIFDSRRCRFRVIDQPDPRAGGGAITHLMRAQTAVAGINGGFFAPDFRPLGLVVSGGSAAGAFERSSLLTGMALQLGDQPYLIWNDEFQGHSGVSELLQAGPRLLDSGQPVAGLEATKKRARSFVATDGRFLWAVGTTEPCSLAALAGMLSTPGVMPGLAPLRALNLDGGNSSALWMRTAEGREISRPGWSTVRNYLAILPK